MGSVGTIAGKVSHDNGTSHIELYSIGMHLRTRTDDLGAHLGFSERHYYFFEDKELKSGFYVFFVPFPKSESIAQKLTTYGLDISLAQAEPGISMGFQETFLKARVFPWSSFYLEYLDSEPIINQFKK